MDFATTAAQDAFATRAKELAQVSLAPGVAARERKESIEPAVIAELAAAGLLGVNVPRAYGGQEAGVLAYVLALREIAMVDAAVAVTMAVTNMVAETLCRFGSEAQKRRHVPSLVRGDYFAGAFALSEPGAGSDAASLTTRATAAGDGYVLNGQKMWITSGDQAGVMVVWARTGDSGPGGISCFLLEQGVAGVSFGKPEDKMGLRASHTVAVGLTDVRVPRDAMLGEPGQGFRIAMTALDGGRIGISAQAVGIATAAWHLVRRYVAAQANPEQHTLFALADMATTLEAAWVLTLQAAWRREQRLPCAREAAMAKVFASESANAVIRQAIQVHGADGYLEAAGLARLFRDCRVTQVYEGTSEIQRLVISRDVLKSLG